MRLAIFHSFLDNIGGAEMVALTLAQELGADVYTTNIDRDKINKMGFGGLSVKSIGWVPVRAPFRQQLALWRWRRLNLTDKYDFFIIAGDWAVSAAVNHHPNLWYVHSLMKEIWDRADDTQKNNVPFYLGPLFHGWCLFNRPLIRNYTQYVDRLVANSLVTKDRVKKFLNREAVLIHPPVKLTKYHYQANGNFWLSVNRLINHKRIELQFEAFAKLPEEKLIIVGSYEQAPHFKKYARHLQRLKPANVEIVSWLDDRQLVDLYSKCKGFLATAQNEDFGLTVVEAMASGKPVIAPDEGGYRESVVNHKCGRLIQDINPDRLAQAIREIGVQPQKYKEDCLGQARKFSLEIFISQIQRQLGQPPH